MVDGDFNMSDHLNKKLYSEEHGKGNTGQLVQTKLSPVPKEFDIPPGSERAFSEIVPLSVLRRGAIHIPNG